MSVQSLRPAELVAITPSGPSMPAMCHDCAFHPDGSPEQDCGRKWHAVLAGVDRGDPFYCHQGMPQDGDTRYVPEMDASGVPVGARVCAGWVAMRARFISVRRADLLDDMAAAAEASPLTVPAVLLAAQLSSQGAAPCR